MTGEAASDRAAAPLHLQFTCEGSTMTGVKLTPEPGAPVGKLVLRFVANKYVVS